MSSPDLTDYLAHPHMERPVSELLTLTLQQLDEVADHHQKTIDQIMEQKRQKIGKVMWLRQKIIEEQGNA